MSKHRTTIDWSIVEDEPSWEKLQAEHLLQSSSTKPVEGLRRQERRLSVFALAIFLTLAAGWQWERHYTQAIVASELEVAITHQVQADQQAQTDSPSVQRLAEQAGIDSSSIEIIDTQIWGEQVMVRVLVHTIAPHGKAQTSRETHFYRKTEAGWQRTEPELNLMGTWQTLETEQFEIHYRPFDSAAITLAAEQLDRDYGQLRRDFGLPHGIGSPRITLRVATEPILQAQVAQPFVIDHANHSITVPSPSLLSAPADLSEDELFIHTLKVPLANLVLAEKLAYISGANGEFKAQWQPLLYGLRLWTVWEGNSRLGVGREAILRWLYANAQAVPFGPRQRNPNGVEEVCQTLDIWHLSPGELAIPIVCGPLANGRWAANHYAPMPLHLNQLTGMAYFDTQGEAPWSAGQIVALETVIEYIVSTYGRPRIPIFVDALARHTTWETLIPAVFGVSETEFEAGWQNYLAQRCTLETEPPTSGQQ